MDNLASTIKGATKMNRVGLWVLVAMASVSSLLHAEEMGPIPRLYADFDVSEYASPRNARAIDPKIVAEATKSKLSPYLGIHCEWEGDHLKIEQVDSLSPAARAGIFVGDIVRLMDGKRISSLDELREFIQSLDPGSRTTMQVERDGVLQELTITLGRPSSPLNGPSQPRAIMGIQTAANEMGGLKVLSITPGMPAEKAGLQFNDLILQIDDRMINEQAKLSEALSDRQVGDKLILKVRRGEKEFKVAVTLAAAPSESVPQNRTSWDTRMSGLFRKPTYRLAVIPVSFPDQELNPKIETKHWYHALFGDKTWFGKNPTGQIVHGSMNDYYQEISCGKLRIEGKVFKPIEVSKNRLDYTTTTNRNTLLGEAIDLLRERDGRDALKDMDGIFYLYAGARAATQKTSLFWPHRMTFVHKGERISYFICPEGGDRMASISVIAHEFGHMLGLPDLYAKPEVPEAEGLGVWCTMATGHGQDGRPLHYSAWCKEQIGWLKPTMIDPAVPQKLILDPIETSSDECFKVMVKPDGSEYLLLENRTRKGFDRDLPGEGLLIWRVVDGRPVLEESHGVVGPQGPGRYLSSVPFPSKANTSFTPYTTPSSRPIKANGKPVHITNIRRLPDGRIAFQIGYEYF
jgi:M6 family metalloprotease-like protein